VTLLLDTHTFLWAIGDVKRLSSAVRQRLEDPEVKRVVSVVPLWEIAVKTQIGKLPMPDDPNFYEEQLALLHASMLPIEARHIFELMRLPLLHRDPFDRMLVAQAKRDSLLLVTCDAAMSGYAIERFW
jgi:PIN domain nuclease of toxin-antitoxin system